MQIFNNPEKAMVVSITLCRRRAIPEALDSVLVLDQLDISRTVGDLRVERSIRTRSVDENIHRHSILTSLVEVFTKELPVHRRECHPGAPFGCRLQVDLRNRRQYRDMCSGLLVSHHQHGIERSKVCDRQPTRDCSASSRLAPTPAFLDIAYVMSKRANR